jgi:hypothetical protein
MLFAALLAGCSKGAPVDPATDAEVRTFFREKDKHPTDVSKLWLAGEADNPLVCGRMKPVPDGTEHRFYYDRTSKHGQTEFSKTVISTTVIGDAIVAKNRELFNDLWDKYCAPTESTLSIF